MKQVELWGNDERKNDKANPEPPNHDGGLGPHEPTHSSVRGLDALSDSSADHDGVHGASDRRVPEELREDPQHHESCRESPATPGSAGEQRTQQQAAQKLPEQAHGADGEGERGTPGRLTGRRGRGGSSRAARRQSQTGREQREGREGQSDRRDTKLPGAEVAPGSLGTREWNWSLSDQPRAPIRPPSDAQNRAMESGRAMRICA